jgi:hypothetical protein
LGLLVEYVSVQEASIISQIRLEPLQQLQISGLFAFNVTARNTPPVPGNFLRNEPLLSQRFQEVAIDFPFETEPNTYPNDSQELVVSNGMTVDGVNGLSDGINLT